MASTYVKDLNAGLENKVDDVWVLGELANKDFSGKANNEIMNYFGTGSNVNPDAVATLIENAASQVSMFFIARSLMRDPLAAAFMKGDNPMGGRIQAMATDIASVNSYRNQLTSNPFEIHPGRTVSEYYNFKLDRSNVLTILGTQANMYFQTPEQLNDYVFSQIESVYNGHVLEQYYYRKLALSVAVMYGKVNYEVAGDSLKLIKTIANALNGFTQATKSYNSKVTYAQPVENNTVIIPQAQVTALGADVQMTVMNPETINQMWGPHKKVVIDQFPDVWLYNKDHVVTQDDVDRGYVAVATEQNPTGIKVGSTLYAGTLAYPGATDSGISGNNSLEPTFNGKNIQAYLCDVDHIIYARDMPINVSSMANKANRTVQIFGHSKESIALSGLKNALAILVAAPDLTDAQKAAINASSSGNTLAGKTIATDGGDFAKWAYSSTPKTSGEAGETGSTGQAGETGSTGSTGQ